MALLGILEFKEAKRIKSILEDRGVILELRSNPQTCSTGGCKITVEVHGNETDLPAIQAFFEEEKSREHAGLEIDPELHDQVFDPERETARCPACGTEFSTTLQECPDCGLSFSTPTQR